jgi:O-antigen ligase
MEWTVLTIFITHLTVILQRYPSLEQRVFWIIIGGFFLVSGDIGIFLSILPNLSGFNLVTDIPHFTNIRHFGAYTAIVCVLLSAGLIKLSTSKLQKNRFSFFVSSLAWSILFWSGSRTGILAASISTFCLTPYLKIIKERISYITIACSTIFAGLCLSFIFPTNNNSMGWNSIVARNAREGLDSISSGRIDLWHFAIKCITSFKEIIFGIGPDVFSIKAFQGHKSVIQPHNMVIQSFLDWGIPGTIMFGVILLTILWNGWRAMSQKNPGFSSYQTAGYGVFICILIMGLFDGAMYHSLQLTMFGASTAIILASQNNNLLKQNAD